MLPAPDTLVRIKPLPFKTQAYTRSHFPISFSLSPIGTSPPSDSTPPCPSDILRCHAKQKTATTSRISRPDTPKQNTPHHIVSQKPSALVHNSALVHKRRVIRESTSKHNTTPSPTSIATLHLSKLTFYILINTHSENIEKHVQHSNSRNTYQPQTFNHTQPWNTPQ